MHIQIEAQSFDFPGLPQSSTKTVDNFVDKSPDPPASPCRTRVWLACPSKRQGAIFNKINSLRMTIGFVAALTHGQRQDTVLCTSQAPARPEQRWKP
jgi:hypothetical protein